MHGLRLLSQAGCERAREEQFHGMDRILGMQVRYGPGYGLFGSSMGGVAGAAHSSWSNPTTAWQWRT